MVLKNNVLPLDDRPTWKATLFGGLKITRDGELISLPPYRAYGLLAVLLLHENQPISRERLGGILYPDLPEQKMRSRISDNIWLIKKQLINFPIITTTESIFLEKQAIWIDVRAFRDEISRDDAPLSETFIDLYKGDLLPELYDEWILVERERWRSQYIRSLRKLINALLQENKFQRAITKAERLLREEPYDESVVRMLMETYARIGRRGAALAAYEKLRLISLEQFGLEPDAETKKLYESIYKQKTIPLKANPVTSNGLTNEPAEILSQAKILLDQGERSLFHETLKKLPDKLEEEHLLERVCLSFDEKLLWDELEEAEKVTQKKYLSSPKIQLRTARIMFVKKQYCQAQELLDSVLHTAHRKKQPLLEAETLITLSMVKAELGENQDALLVLDKAIFLAEKTEAFAMQVQAYIQKGIFRNLKGTGEDAKEILTKAVEIARKHRLRPLLAQALGVLGTNANYYGDYQFALAYLKECLELARDIGMGALEAKALLTLSGTYDYLGRFQETKDSIENATKYYKEKGDSFGLAKCYYNLSYSIVSVNEKHTDEAIRYAEQALQIFLEQEDLGWQASTHTALGYFHWLIGLAEQAIQHFDTAIRLHARLEEYRFIPENYAYKGLAYISKNLPQKALEFTRLAVQDLTRRNLSDIAAEIYYAHASVLQALGDKTESRIYVELGYDLLVEGAGEIEDDHAREAYFYRDPMTRRLMQMAHDFGIAPIPEKKIITRHLPGSGHYTVDVSLTLDAGAPDQALQAAKGATALRRARIKRIVKEGNIHGNLISIKYLAQLFRVNPRTIQRDLRIIAKEFPEEEK